MKKFKIFFKIISIIVILTFLNLEFAWAYPSGSPELFKQDKLAAQPMFQQSMMTDVSADLQAAMFSDIDQMCSILNIASFLLGSFHEIIAKKKRKARLSYLKGVMEKELGKAAKDISLEKVNFEDDSCKIVLIPLNIGGEECIAQVALREEIKEGELLGRKWDVSGKFVIKIVKKGMPSEKVQTKEEPKEEVNKEPAEVIEVDLDAADAPIVKKDKPKARWMILGKVSIKNLASIVSMMVVTYFGLEGVLHAAEGTMGLTNSSAGFDYYLYLSLATEEIKGVAGSLPVMSSYLLYALVIVVAILAMSGVIEKIKPDGVEREEQKKPEVAKEHKDPTLDEPGKAVEPIDSADEVLLEFEEAYISEDGGGIMTSIREKTLKLFNPTGKMRIPMYLLFGGIITLILVFPAIMVVFLPLGMAGAFVVNTAICQNNDIEQGGVYNDAVELLARGIDFLVPPLQAAPRQAEDIHFSVKTHEEVSAFLRGNYTGYVLEIKFKGKVRAQIQPWFKNSSWANLYAFPKRPNSSGIVRFDPAKDPCNVCQFRDLSDVAEIGFKVWGGNPEDVLSQVEYARLVPAGKKKAPAPEKQRPRVQPAPAIRQTPQRPTEPIKPEAEEFESVASGATEKGAIEIPLENGWQAQSWRDSQAVRSVYYDPRQNAIVGEVDLIQGDAERDRGEVIVDLMHIGMDEFNFQDYTLKADVRVVVDSGRFGGTNSRPDGVGFFVKTGPGQSWSNMYDWENISPSEIGKWQPISFSFNERRKRDIVYVDSNFPTDNPRIRMFGVKIGAGSGTGSKFRGKIYLRNIRLVPNSQVQTAQAPTFWPQVPQMPSRKGAIQIPVTEGWVARDQKGNRAVREVFVSPDGRTLALKVKFKGGDPFGEFNKGSAYLLLYDKQGNLLYDIPHLPKKGFMNWKNTVIRAKVWAPASFAQGKTIPSAVLIGSHDALDNYQNGAWQEGLITHERTDRWDDSIRYYPTDPKTGNPGYTNPTYDVTRGKEMLIKVGLPGATTPDYEWKGFIYVTDIRIELDDRTFEDPIPELIWTDPKRAVPVTEAPVSPEMFKEWSGGSGYGGQFDRALTLSGIREFGEHLDRMGPDAKTYRYMALFGSLPEGGPLVFDKDNNFIGYADPDTGRMGSTPTEMLPKILERISMLVDEARKRGKKLIIVNVAHDAIDGMGGKEGRKEGDRPSLFTSERKFKKFREGLRPITEHLSSGENRKTVEMLELLNEPLNADTNKVPIPFIQRRIHEYNCDVHQIDPTMYLSTGMRDTASWQYFAFMVFPEAKVGDQVIKIPYYKQVIPQSHWYADKEGDTPLGTNVGNFVVPDYILGWLKGEIDPRTPQEYKAAIGVVEAMKRIYEAGYMGALFWMDRPGEFWPEWIDFKHFFEDVLPKRAPFASPQATKEVKKSIYWAEKEAEVDRLIVELGEIRDLMYVHRPELGSEEDIRMKQLATRAEAVLARVSTIRKRRAALKKGSVTEKGTKGKYNGWIADATQVTSEVASLRAEIFPSTTPRDTRDTSGGWNYAENMKKTPYDHAAAFFAKTKGTIGAVNIPQSVKVGAGTLAGVVMFPAIAFALDDSKVVLETVFSYVIGHLPHLFLLAILLGPLYYFAYKRFGKSGKEFIGYSVIKGLKFSLPATLIFTSLVYFTGWLPLTYNLIIGIFIANWLCGGPMAIFTNMKKGKNNDANPAKKIEKTPGTIVHRKEQSDDNDAVNSELSVGIVDFSLMGRGRIGTFRANQSMQRRLKEADVKLPEDFYSVAMGLNYMVCPFSHHPNAKDDYWRTNRSPSLFHVDAENFQVAHVGMARRSVYLSKTLYEIFSRAGVDDIADALIVREAAIYYKLRELMGTSDTYTEEQVQQAEEFAERIEKALVGDKLDMFVEYAVAEAIYSQRRDNLIHYPDIADRKGEKPTVYETNVERLIKALFVGAALIENQMHKSKLSVEVVRGLLKEYMEKIRKNGFDKLKVDDSIEVLWEDITIEELEGSTGSVISIPISMNMVDGDKVLGQTKMVAKFFDVENGRKLYKKKDVDSFFVMLDRGTVGVEVSCPTKKAYQRSEMDALFCGMLDAGMFWYNGKDVFAGVSREFTGGSFMDPLKDTKPKDLKAKEYRGYVVPFDLSMRDEVVNLILKLRNEIEGEDSKKTAVQYMREVTFAEDSQGASEEVDQTPLSPQVVTASHVESREPDAVDHTSAMAQVKTRSSGLGEDLTPERTETQQKVDKLFERVQQINDRRTRLVDAANDIIRLLKKYKASFPIKEEDLMRVNLIDEGRNTIEVIYKLLELAAMVENLDLSSLTGILENEDDLNRFVSAQKELLGENIEKERYKNIYQLEIDSIISNLIIRARYLKKTRDNTPLVIGIETDWIPGIDDEASLQSQAMNPLLSELYKFEVILKELGLDNVVVIHKEKNETLDEWVEKLNGQIKDREDMSNVFILGGQRSISTVRDSFDHIRSYDTLPFYVQVNPSLLKEEYLLRGKDVSKQCLVQILAMLSLAFELNNGHYLISQKYIDRYFSTFNYDLLQIGSRHLYLTPKAIPMEYEELRALNNLRARLIDAAA